MHKSVATKDLFTCDISFLKDWFNSFQYPWEMLPEIGTMAKKLIAEGIDGYKLIQDDVLVGENVTIYPNVTIEGPAVIGSGTEIRPGAFIRGKVIIGENCTIGNSTELKNCVLLNRVQVPHYNYVGDSVLGNHAHMGAGAICSNLKADGKGVVIHGEEDYETGMRKIGGMIADDADIGCGCVLNPGTVVGRGTTAYPLVSLRGVYPAGCIIKDKNLVVIRKK